MLICDCCGDVIDESELETYTDRDYIDGCCVREDVIDASCHCGGTYIDAVQCGICGKWIPKEEGDRNWCYSEEHGKCVEMCNECVEQFID